MKKSLVVCIEKIYVNKNVHTLIYNEENLKIMGVYQSYRTTDFIESVSDAQKKQISRYLQENCMDSCSVARKISGTIMIKRFELSESKIEKTLLIKGISIIGFYQNNGVDFIERIDKEAKKEALKELYMFGYISADIYSKILNKIEAM